MFASAAHDGSVRIWTAPPPAAPPPIPTPRVVNDVRGAVGDEAANENPEESPTFESDGAENEEEENAEVEDGGREGEGDEGMLVTERSDSPTSLDVTEATVV